ncbi:MAG: hypothetical protein ACI9FN_001713 [Saprospiraceae bacterium]|jgi:hypothetical protein
MKKYLISLMLIVLYISSSIAQQKEEIQIRVREDESPISFRLKNDAKPDVYIDGKKYDAAIINLLDQNQIATMNVIKGEEAIKKYNAPNGVIIIVSKKNSAAENLSFTIDEGNTTIDLQNSADNSKKPLLIVDGKTWDHDSLKELDPNDIETIDVIKGEKAYKLYKAKNGVIIVKTKKKEDE